VGWYVAAAVLCVLILASLVYAIRCWPRRAVAAVQEVIEYEPLSKVNDGSYDETESGGPSRKALGVLRRLRRR